VLDGEGHSPGQWRESGRVANATDEAFVTDSLVGAPTLLAVCPAASSPRSPGTGRLDIRSAGGR
jgi:hypothetical protein